MGKRRVVGQIYGQALRLLVKYDLCRGLNSYDKTSTHTYSDVHIDRCVCIYICMFTHTPMFIYICMYVCMAGRQAG